MPFIGMSSSKLTFSAVEISHPEDVGGTALGRAVETGTRGVLPGLEARPVARGSR